MVGLWLGNVRVGGALSWTLTFTQHVTRREHINPGLDLDSQLACYSNAAKRHALKAT